MPLTKVPVTNRPELHHVKLKAAAKKAKAQTLSVASDLKAHDQTETDNWKQPDEVMISKQDHHRNWFQRLFGTGETLAGSADFDGQNVKKMAATVTEEAHTPLGQSEYYYEKLNGGDEVYVAPNRTEAYIRREEVGRSKTTTYYKTYDVYEVTYTAVRESADGTLFVDDTSTNPQQSLDRLKELSSS